MSKQLDSLNEKLKANQAKLAKLTAKGDKITNAIGSVNGVIKSITDEIAVETEKEKVASPTKA